MYRRLPGAGVDCVQVHSGVGDLESAAGLALLKCEVLWRMESPPGGSGQVQPSDLFKKSERLSRAAVLERNIYIECSSSARRRREIFWI